MGFWWVGAWLVWRAPLSGRTRCWVSPWGAAYPRRGFDPLLQPPGESGRRVLLVLPLSLGGSSPSVRRVPRSLLPRFGDWWERSSQHTPASPRAAAGGAWLSRGPSRSGSPWIGDWNGGPPPALHSPSPPFLPSFLPSLFFLPQLCLFFFVWGGKLWGGTISLLHPAIGPPGGALRVRSRRCCGP